MLMNDLSNVVLRALFSTLPIQFMHYAFRRILQWVRIKLTGLFQSGIFHFGLTLKHGEET